MSWPQSLFGRLVVLLIAALILGQLLLVSVIIVQINQARVADLHGIVLAPRIAHAIDLIELAPTDLDARLKAADVSRVTADFVPNAMRNASLEAQLIKMQAVPYLAARLVEGTVTMPPFAPVPKQAEVVFSLNGRDYFRLANDMSRPTRGFSFALYGELAWRLLVVFVVAAIITRWLVKPLNRVVAAADAFGRGQRFGAPLVETGASEFRRLTRAFNEMQARIQRFVDDRTRLLTAISHDLRTPVTRALLRLELLPEGEVRDKCTDDLMNISRMIDVTLDLARLDVSAEAVHTVDIQVLVEAVAGHPLPTLNPPAQILGRSTALQRLFQNLQDNAERHGKPPFIWAITVVETEVWVTLADGGPGISEALHERVFEPFFRADPARSEPALGIGLGLAIARDIARSHGGDITLANRAEGGLVVRVALPRVVH
jgi:signal transduction histidine kinase